MQVLIQIEVMGSSEFEHNKNGYLDKHFYYFVVDYILAPYQTRTEADPSMHQNSTENLPNLP